MSGVFSALGLETALLSRRLRLFAVAALAGVVLALFSVGFFAFAAYLALLSRLAPWLAAICVGAGALVLGGILLLAAVQALGRAANQIEVAVKTNAVVRAAPVVARIAMRSPRLIAAAAALLTAIIALMRALNARAQKAES
jgi:hypothetical protein